VTVALAAAAPLLALLIYLAVGSPGAPDQPFARRLADWKVHPERYAAPELTAALRALAAEHPNDPEPQRRLAGLELSQGDPNAAIHALRKAVAIAPDRADLLALLGEVMVLKAGGAVEPDAEAIFLQALRSDPGSATARYYLARARIAAGDAAAGLVQWRALMGALPADDPRRPVLAEDIAAVEKTGRLPVATPAAAPDQSAQLSGAIRGMVDGLAARLTAHPDDPAGWVRLVRAYGVLGEKDKQAAALAEARRRYAGRPDILTALAAARQPPSPNP
jgi:cytochrome c-type biogenesis protein CcmH